MLTYFIESLQKGDQVWKKTNYVAIMILIGRKKKEYIDMFTRNVKNEKKTSYRMIINLIHIRNGKNMYG